MNIKARLRDRYFDGILVYAMPTGSAIYGTAQDPSDLDYICLNYDGLHTLLTGKGWSGHLASGDGRFQSLKKGFINLILGEPDFVKAWMKAHDHLLKNPHLAATKESRIAVFEAFGAGRD